MAQTFIANRQDRAEAWGLCHAYAEQLKAQGLTENYGVTVIPHRTSGRLGRWQYWIVLVTGDDKTESEFGTDKEKERGNHG